MFSLSTLPDDWVIEEELKKHKKKEEERVPLPISLPRDDNAPHPQEKKKGGDKVIIIDI